MPSEIAKQQLLRALGVGDGDTSGSFFRFVVDGAAVELQIERSKTWKPWKKWDISARLDVGLVAPPPPARVAIRREDGIDRAATSLRINREYRTGDAAFDAFCYLEGDVDDAVLARVLGSAEVRRLVRAVLAGGAIDEVSFTEKGRILLRLPEARFSEGAALLAAVALAVRLPAELERAAQDARRAREVDSYRDGDPSSIGERALPERRGRFLAALLVSLGLFPLGGFLLGRAPPTVQWTTMETAVLAALAPALMVAYAAFLVALLRGRSDSLRWVGIFFVLGGLSGGGLCHALVEWANATFDSGPRTVVTGTVERVSNGKGGGTHVVASLLGSTASLRGDDPALDSRPRGASFTIGQGAFGAPWVESHRLLPR